MCTYAFKLVTNTHSQTHKDIIIQSQSSSTTNISSEMFKSSSDVDGPSYFHSKFTSLQDVDFNIVMYNMIDIHKCTKAT